jgi:3-oxoacyl-ACP reductase-like protein
MSVFGAIKDFLFGKQFITVKHGDAKPAQAAPQPAPQAAPTPAVANAPQPPQPAETAVQDRVDIAAVLDHEAASAGQKLDWRHSIVDLMKLTGIDSSLENRKELAKELGYTGDMNDSATMNIWLHKAVMQKLEASGGQVPAELK